MNAKTLKDFFVEKIYKRSHFPAHLKLFQIKNYLKLRYLKNCSIKKVYNKLLYNLQRQIESLFIF